MLMLPPSVRVFLAAEPVDMRRSFDGLAMAVEMAMGSDPFCGHFFVFRSKRGNRVKILFWDRDGFVLYYKRLEKGCFKFPTSEATTVEVEAGELALLLEGIDLAGVRRRPRFERRKASPSA